MELLLRDAGPRLLARYTDPDTGEVAVPVVDVSQDWDGSHVSVAPSPRWVDGHCWEERAVQVGGLAHKRLTAMVNDARNHSDEGLQEVNDEYAVVAMCAPTTGRWLAVAVRFTGYDAPGVRGRWQRYPMRRYEAEAYIDCYDVAADAEEVAFAWASQWQQQLAYDLEGLGENGDALQTVVGYLKPRSQVQPPTGAHPGWRRPPSAWKVTKLPPTRRWQSSPFAGMRNQGSAPDEG